MQTLDSKTAHKIVSELVFVMKNGKLTPKFISNIMTKFVGGTDADGAWDWRQAQDLMQAAALQLVCTQHFDQSASADDVLSRLAHFSGQLPTETRRSERQMMLQQFSTPLPYAWLAVAAADLQKSDCVLEPSAGTGALARLAAQMGATVFANELDPLRQMLLSLYSKNTVTSHDAEFIDDLLDAKVQPSVILMNPPFSSSTARSADPSIALRHVISAAKRLQMGGRLVAIVPPCAHPHRSKALWDRLLAHVTPVLRITLPGTVYAKMGTSVETHLLIADKGDSATAYPEVRCGSLDEALHVIKERVPARLKLTRSFKATGASIAANLFKTAPKKPRQLLLVRGKGAQSTTSASNLSLVPGVFPETRTNEAISAIYARYAPQRFTLEQAQPHPTSLVESIAMGSVAPPLPCDVPLQLPERLVLSGALSEPQLETLVMAETSFAQDLPGRFVTDEEGRLQRDDADEEAVAYRQGYFLGDGTGCGKGREVAGLILTGWLAGRKRAVWVSKSATLIEDARRDWSDLGGAPTDIHALSKWKPDDDITLGNGILFVTYSTLRSVSRSGVRRLDQLLNWLGDDFDGILAFDEAHAMQNAAGSEGARGKAGPSQQGLAGLQVQMKLPRARVLYVSATGATNVGNLAYATRLGLWGQGPEYAFTSRSAFVSAMEAGGVAAMEVVARDLKALGLYTARALSFDGVEYDIFEHQLTDSQIELYDTYAEAFQIIHQNLHHALEATGITSSAGGSEKGASASKSAAISAFESTKQRLFNHLLQGLKAPAVIDEMKRDLNDGWSPVVQIVSTGEALLKRRIETLDAGDELVEGMLTPRECVLSYLERAFPVQQQQLIEQEDGHVLAQPMLDGNGAPVISREAVALRDEAMEAILCLAPVPSALDQIIWSLGADVVAEVTGRSQRPVKNKTGRLSIERRSASASSAETTAFMSGEKHVLIFSDAGGTGRSYQAAKTATNQNRRRHYLLEPGWRADNAIQGLGRTHRAAQVSAPFFRVCTTNVHGEKRFTSTIARRLDTLGALIKGQRETASQGMFRPEDNLESPIARASLRSFYVDLVYERADSISLESFCEWTGLKLIDAEGQMLENLPPIQRFLNRVLALPIDLQNAIFTEFMGKIEMATERARAAGMLDVGLETLRGDRIVAHAGEELRVCPKTKAITSLVPLTVERSMHYMSAVDVLAKYDHLVPMENLQSGKFALISAKSRSAYGDDGDLVLERWCVRPQKKHLIPDDGFIKSNWEICSKDRFIKGWNEEVQLLPAAEKLHIYLLTGLILPIWQDVPGENARIYRVITEEGDALLGRALSEDEAAIIRGKFLSFDSTTPDGVITAVRSGRQQVDIGNGLKLVQRRIAGNQRLEIEGADRDTVQWLKSLGCFTEIHQYQLRVFLPNGDAAESIVKVVLGGGDLYRAA